MAFWHSDVNFIVIEVTGTDWNKSINYQYGKRHLTSLKMKHFPGFRGATLGVLLFPNCQPSQSFTHSCSPEQPSYRTLTAENLHVFKMPGQAYDGRATPHWAHASQYRWTLPRFWQPTHPLVLSVKRRRYSSFLQGYSNLILTVW